MRLFSIILIALATLATPVRTLSNPRSASSSTLATAVASRARGCPPSQIVAQYYPNWTNQSPAQIEWGYADLAFLFVVVTTPSGFAWPDASKTWDFLGEARKRSSFCSSTRRKCTYTLPQMGRSLSSRLEDGPDLDTFPTSSPPRPDAQPSPGTLRVWSIRTDSRE